MFEDLEHAALMAGIRKGLKQAFIEAGEKARHPYRGNQFGKDKGTGKGSGTSGEVTSPAYRHTKEAQPDSYGDKGFHPKRSGSMPQPKGPINDAINKAGFTYDKGLGTSDWPEGGERRIYVNKRQDVLQVASPGWSLTTQAGKGLAGGPDKKSLLKHLEIK